MIERQKRFQTLKMCSISCARALDSIKDKTNLFEFSVSKMAFWRPFEEDTSAPHHKKSGERMTQLHDGLSLLQ
jgi:hypothetical protein